MSSSVLKTLKRSMAAEYSRELAVKAFAGQCRLIELGFRQDGAAGYGQRRQLIDRNQAPKVLLGRGERKSLQTDRVTLAPGRQNKIQNIYTRFVMDKQTACEVAEQLNGAGILGERSRPWTRATIHQVLTNPKYIGTKIYNRRSFKLKHKLISAIKPGLIGRRESLAKTFDDLGHQDECRERSNSSGSFSPDPCLRDKSITDRFIGQEKRFRRFRRFKVGFQ
jgi:Recombinase